MPQRTLAGLPLLFLPLLVTGCDEAKRFMEKVDAFSQADQEYVPVPGEDAPKFLEPVISSLKTDVAGALEAMKLAAEEKTAAGLTMLASGKPATISENGANVLLSTQKAKETFDSSTFKLDDDTKLKRLPNLTLSMPKSFSMVANTVVWTSPLDEFTVSMLDRMPTRHQGSRGTCAAHAAAAHLEGFVLKKYPSIEAIDLSEQRIYYMARPDHWATGGDPNNEGASPSDAFVSSTDYDWSKFYPEVSYPSDWPKGLNIPLETDCPYEPMPASTNLHVPQPAGCTKGALRVTDYNAWTQNYEQDILSPQQIYNFLLEKDYPVITAGLLSENWSYNDGIITSAEAGKLDASKHAAGHAYVIVGARKLDEAQYPGEGGMCFIIKNSWGTGWGVNGLSCMTLAYFNEWQFQETSMGTVLDVEMDEAAAKLAMEEAKKTIPDDMEEPDPDTKGSDDVGPYGGNKKKRGEAHVSHLVDAGEGLTLAASDFTVGELIASDGQSYKLLYRTDGVTFTVRGVLKGQKKQTNDLNFGLKDGKLLTYPPGEEGARVFGEWDEAAQRVVLCSQKYATVCDLRYHSEWNELVTGLTETAARAEEATEPFSWQGFDFEGYGIEISIPKDRLGRVDVRFKLNDAYTNPQRFAVDVSSGKIQWHGKEIGSFTEPSLCSGEYASLCRIVVAGSDFHVLMRAAKK